MGPVDLHVLGLNVALDDCNNGPVNVAITAQSGAGNLLGNLLGSVAHLLDSPGNPVHAVEHKINDILHIAQKAPALPA